LFGVSEELLLIMMILGTVMAHVRVPTINR